MEQMKNLCAPIPAELHARVREAQEQSGETLGQYITKVLTDYYENLGKTTMDSNTRTVAFQIPEELFEQLKEYLKARHIKQKDFILGLLQRALEDDPVVECTTEKTDLNL